MSFINQALLYGLAGISIPIILHLLNRRSAKQIEWGAMQFLLDSVESRKRRIQLEEALLLAARCLLFGLVALAVARPFQPPGGKIPYVVILPAFLLALVSITTGIILRENKKLCFWLVLAGLGLLVFSGLSVAYERWWNLKRYGNTGRKDIVFIVDGSTSMQIKEGGSTNFDRAIQEAKEVLEKSSGGNAFSLILGGPVPLVKVGDPIVNKTDLSAALDSLKPMKGKMDGFAALTTALTALNRGSNPSKEIIVFTDGQAIGWNLDSTASWDALKGSADQLTTKPPILYRTFSLPKTFRNVSLNSVHLSRDVLGTDRPVGIEMTLENTGTEAITPTSVEVSIGVPPTEGVPPTGEVKTETFVRFVETKLNQLKPGVKETVRFTHQFTKPGSYLISAKVVTQDDLPIDDTSETVAQVLDSLRVLIVEGNPNAEVLKRAATFTALALAPRTSLAPLPPNQPKKEGAPAFKPGVLLDPEVVPHTRLANIASFADYQVVILCNVPRLADSAARKLAGWVQAGGGLLVAPGNDSEAAFYNGWKTIDGNTLLPGRLVDQKIIQTNQEPMGLALNTFTHSALRLVADAKQSDLGGSVLQRYWKIDPDSATSVGTLVGGRLANGDPFLSLRPSGLGSVMLSAASFDTSSGNLATRQAFVPLLHQLVYHLTAPNGQPLQMQPAQQLNVSLMKNRGEGGFKVEYFQNKGFTPPAFATRVESVLDRTFDAKILPKGMKSDNLSVRFSGALLPKYSDEYVFEGWADDEIHLWVNNERLITKGGDGKIKLEAGKYVPIRLEYANTNGGATFALSWRSTNPQFQPRGPIQADFVLPFVPGAEDKESLAGTMSVTGPDNVNRDAQLLYTKGGLVARLSSDVVPGTYRIRVPEARRADFPQLMTTDGTIPFSVADDPAESHLSSWTERDLAMVKNHFEFLQPQGAKDITNILAGREFGEELWKYLAVGALFILLAEIALTRWIALNRRAGEEISLDFEHKFTAPKQFTDQLTKIQQANAA